MSDLSVFRSKLPDIQEWIDETLEKYSDRAIPVTSIPFPNLRNVLPSDILEKTRFVVIDGPLPVPPLYSNMGLKGLKKFEEGKGKYDGITYKDTYFIKLKHLQSEKLHFHELVHVVQWAKLGVDNFLLAYGAGMMLSGYRGSPLEEMAYSLADEFDSDLLPDYVDKYIRKKTDGIWNDVQTLLDGGRG